MLRQCSPSISDSLANREMLRCTKALGLAIGQEKYIVAV